MDIAAISKICSKCKTNKPTTDFAKSGDGFQAYCRDCMKEYRKNYIDEDKPDENALYILSYEHNLSGPFKIGRTNCVEARVAQLEASHCFRIVVHAVFPQRGDLERKIHEQLAPFQVTGFRGKEWFNCPLAAIVATVAGHL
jgi:hypothetical protein